MTTFTSLYHKGIFAFLLLLLICPMVSAQYVYVKSTASGQGNGTSWTDAYSDLQVAFNNTTTGDTICVASGTYFPSIKVGGDAGRNATFHFDRDMTILGGYTGQPGTEGLIDTRDHIINPTILTGDLGVPNDPADNAFHVVYLDHVSDTFRLEGFYIEKGNGIDGGGFDATGTGIFINAENGRCHPTLINCEVSDMVAGESGGGIEMYASNGKCNPKLIGCSIINCEGSGGGGISINADLNGESKPVMINCRFAGNTARTAQGSAVSVVGHSVPVSPRFINCIFTGNYTPTSQAVSIFLTGTGISQSEFINCTFSGNAGGIIRLSNIGTDQSSVVFARNCIFWGNAGSGISVSGGTPDIAHSVADFFGLGDFIINLNPNFVSQPAIPTDHAHVDGDVHVHDDSPAIDAGLNASVPSGIDKDYDGLPRFINPFNGLAGKVDCGPFEIQESTSAVTPVLPESAWSVYPNPASEFVKVQMEKHTGSAVLHLTDLNGRPVHTSVQSSGQVTTLDFSTLSPGVYFLQAQLDGKSGTKFIVKE